MSAQITIILISIIACILLAYLYLLYRFFKPKLYRRENQILPIEEYIVNGHVPEKIRFETSDKIPASGLFYSAGNGINPVILVLHGYRTRMGLCPKRIEAILNSGWHVFTFDFRGCGESEEKYNTVGLQETNDVIGAVQYLQTRDDVDLTRIGLWGSSMGASTAIRSLPLIDNVNVVIADSPFYSLLENLRHKITRKGLPSIMAQSGIFMISLIVRKNMWFNYAASTLRIIDEIPILFIHGDADEDIAYNDSVRLHKIYEGPKEFLHLEGQGHHDHDDFPGYLDKCTEFIRKYL